MELALRFCEIKRVLHSITCTINRARIELDIDPDTSQLRNFFICPSASRLSFENVCLPMIVSDGTFTKAKFRQILLFAVTRCKQSHFAARMGFVLGENEATWRFFLGELAL